jgi:uncharacterized protein
MFTFDNLPTLIASGFAVGGLVGLTGVGGGSLMTPLLISVMHVNAAIAVGTDLLFAAITKSSGVWVHAKRGNVDWRLTGALCAGSAPAAALTLLLIRANIGSATDASKLMRPALGIVLVATALAVALRPRLVAALDARRAGRTQRPQAPHAKAIITGALLGIVVTLTSVGAGAMGVTALLMLYPLLPFSRVVGSDIAHAVPLTFIAGSGHMLMGNVDFALLGGLLVGSLPGIYLGSRFSARVPEHFLRYLLCALLLFASLKMLAL